MKHPTNASSGIFQRCPHLGLQDDRSTSLAYSSTWNYCYQAVPPESVQIAHQEVVCLAAAHQQCPVFLRAASGPLPADLRGNHEVLPSAASRRGWAAVLVVTAILVLAGAIYFLPRMFSGPAPVSVASSLASPTETVLSSATPTNTAVNNPAHGIIASFTADALTRVANFTATPKFTGTPPTATMTATFTRTSTPTKTFTSTRTPTRTLTPTITTSPVPSATRTFAPPPSTGTVCGHPLDTPFGGNIKFLLHRILTGENLTIYADTYGTTTAAILAVNYRLPLPVWADWVVAIPYQTDSVENIPPFEPYQSVDARISLDELARQLNTDAASLQTYNNFQEPCTSFSGWLLVPRTTP